MYLLDTNVLMHLANRTAGHEQIREKLSRSARATLLFLPSPPLSCGKKP